MILKSYAVPEYMVPFTIIEPADLIADGNRMSKLLKN